MKNRRSTRYCLPLACLLALTACAPGGDAAEPAPVSVPPPVEQTNTELHIFYTDADAIQTSTLDAAVTQYNQRHPDNPVTAEKIFTDGSDTVRDEQTRRMLAEVMAGEGPDLIFFVDDSMDVEKMARRGVWDGQRLVIPLEYKMPILYTTQTALDETGFSVENCATFDGFLTEAEKLQNTPGQTRSLYRTFLAFKDFAQYAAIPYADYARQRADLSYPELERGLTVYQNVTDLYYDSDAVNGAGGIRDGLALWCCPVFPPEGPLIAAGLINTFDEPVMMPIRDREGGIQAKITFSVAARNSSPNLQNAYEFIKFLLSEEFQLDTIGWRWQNFSVLDAANERYYIENTVERDNSMIAPDNPYGFEGNIVLPQADYDELASYMGEVSGAFFYTKETSFLRNMDAYLSGEASYEEAAQAAERQLNIYLSE